MISREEMEQQGATTVAEVLRNVPGLQVVQSGSPGRVTSVFLRGGAHYLREPIRFLPEDSGAQECPVSYRSYEDEEVIVATNRGRPLALENSSRAGEAFNNIARRLLGEEVPLMSMEKEGFFSLVKRFFRS